MARTRPPVFSHIIAWALLASAAVACWDGPTAVRARVAAVELEPDSARMDVGDTLVAAARVLDSRGQELSDEPVTWSSSDSTVVAVSASGLVRALGAGQARVLAAAGGRQDSLLLTVRRASPTGLRCPDGEGTGHVGTVGAERWQAVDNPHCLLGTVNVIGGPLTIGAGVVVRGEPGVELVVGGNTPTSPAGRLVVEGTSEAPVILTAADSTRPWGGIRGYVIPVRDAVTLSWGVVEHAQVGVVFLSATLRDCRFRKIRREAASALGRSGVVDMERCTVEDAALDGGVPAVQIGSNAGRARFVDSTIRRSGGAGLQVRGHGLVVEISGGRIEDSAGDGLVQTLEATYAVSSAPVRVVGSGGYPVRVLNGGFFFTIWPTAADQALLLGNAKDTVVLGPPLRDYDGTVSADLPWVTTRSDVANFRLRSLLMEPGATLLNRGSVGVSVGSLRAEGTAGQPVRLDDVFLLVEGADTTRISHAELRGVHLVARGAPLLADHLSGSRATLTLSAGGSRLTDAEFEGSRKATVLALAPDVRLNRVTVRESQADGIVVDGDGVEIAHCTITGSVGDGVRVIGGSGVRVRDCNLESNGGSGVANVSPHPVDATLNWWGSPEGPNGPGGDGVENATYTPFHTAPVAGLTRSHTGRDGLRVDREQRRADSVAGHDLAGAAIVGTSIQPGLPTRFDSTYWCVAGSCVVTDYSEPWDGDRTLVED